MAVHKLFMGGKGPSGGVAPGTYNAQFFPAVAPGPDEYLTIDARRLASSFGITRNLVWKRMEGPLYTLEPRSPGLANYLDHNTIAAGDILQIMLLPKDTELLRIYWEVVEPLAGFDFNIRVDDSTAGGTVTVLGGPISAAAAGKGVIDVYAVNGGAPFVLNQNGVLELEIVNLPAAGIRDSVVRISARLDKLNNFGDN